MSFPIESLPPAARRKFFSNAEYLRLAHDDRCHGLDHQYKLGKAPYQQSQLPWDWPPLTATDRPARKKVGFKRVVYPVNSQKPGILMPERAFLTAFTDWQCFHSLPPKIQQRCFSNEERTRLHKLCCMNEVLDAADEAFFRVEKRRRMSESAEAASILQSSSRCFLIPDVDQHNGMDNTLDAVLGRLDEEDLDLSLDEYHAHVVDSPSSLPLKSRLSFPKALPFNPADPGLKPLSTMHGSSHPSHSSTASKANMTTLSYNAEACRSQSQFYQTFRSTTSSIDPPAQYYRDPEARLKLRVYLASPQKFDEAVEFGFPTLKGLARQGRDFRQPINETPPVGAFLEEDQVFSGVEPQEEPSTLQVPRHIRYPRCQQSPLHLKHKQHQWLPSSKPDPRRSPSNREMTLKMTLTRPDLRTDPATLKSTELLPDKIDPQIWKSEMLQQSLLKKMWRTLRRQK